MKKRYEKSALNAVIQKENGNFNAKKRFVHFAKKLSDEGEISKEALDGLVFLIEEYFDDSFNKSLENDYEL